MVWVGLSAGRRLIADAIIRCLLEVRCLRWNTFHPSRVPAPQARSNALAGQILFRFGYIAVGNILDV